MGWLRVQTPRGTNIKFRQPTSRPYETISFRCLLWPVYSLQLTVVIIHSSSESIKNQNQERPKNYFTKNRKKYFRNKKGPMGKQLRKTRLNDNTFNSFQWWHQWWHFRILSANRQIHTLDSHYALQHTCLFMLWGQVVVPTLWRHLNYQDLLSHLTLKSYIDLSLWQIQLSFPELWS